MSNESRARARQARRRSVRELNLADFGDAYNRFERMVATRALPPWPITQCLSQRKHGMGRCGQRFSQPGQTLCRYHFGTTKRSRTMAIRRYVTWILCGYPTGEPLILEAMLTESIVDLLASQKFQTEITMVDRVKFISDVLTFVGVVDLARDDHGARD